MTADPTDPSAERASRRLDPHARRRIAWILVWWAVFAAVLFLLRGVISDSFLGVLAAPIAFLAALGLGVYTWRHVRPREGDRRHEERRHDERRHDGPAEP